MVKETKRKPTGAAALGAGPGRPKGLPNKNSAQLKQMILDALTRSGGVDYLVECANNEKTKGAFLALIGKVLPMTIAGDGENPAKIVFEWKQRE